MLNANAGGEQPAAEKKPKKEKAKGKSKEDRRKAKKSKAARGGGSPEDEVKELLSEDAAEEAADAAVEAEPATVEAEREEAETASAETEAAASDALAEAAKAEAAVNAPDAGFTEGERAEVREVSAAIEQNAEELEEARIDALALSLAEGYSRDLLRERERTPMTAAGTKQFLRERDAIVARAVEAANRNEDIPQELRQRFASALPETMGTVRPEDKRAMKLLVSPADLLNPDITAVSKKRLEIVRELRGLNTRVSSDGVKRDMRDAAQEYVLLGEELKGLREKARGEMDAMGEVGPALETLMSGVRQSLADMERNVREQYAQGRRVAAGNERMKKAAAPKEAPVEVATQETAEASGPEEQKAVDAIVETHQEKIRAEELKAPVGPEQLRQFGEDRDQITEATLAKVDALGLEPMQAKMVKKMIESTIGMAQLDDKRSLLRPMSMEAAIDRELQDLSRNRLLLTEGVIKAQKRLSAVFLPASKGKALTDLASRRQQLYDASRAEDERYAMLLTTTNQEKSSQVDEIVRAARKELEDAEGFIRGVQAMGEGEVAPIPAAPEASAPAPKPESDEFDVTIDAQEKETAQVPEPPPTPKEDPVAAEEVPPSRVLRATEKAPPRKVREAAPATAPESVPAASEPSPSSRRKVDIMDTEAAERSRLEQFRDAWQQEVQRLHEELRSEHGVDNPVAAAKKLIEGGKIMRTLSGLTEKGRQLEAFINAGKEYDKAVEQLKNIGKEAA